MKKVVLLVVSMLLLLSLCACSGSKEPYTVKEGWRTFEIDPEVGTISHKEDVFRYDISNDPDGYTLTITYPDGSTYFVKQQEFNSGTHRTSGHSEDYDAMRYVDGGILYNALENELPAPLFPGNPVLGFLLIGLGILGAFWPRIVWWLTIGWLIKDAEPSNIALIAYRIIGVLLILSGIIKLFIA